MLFIRFLAVNEPLFIVTPIITPPVPPTVPSIKSDLYAVVFPIVIVLLPPFGLITNSGNTNLPPILSNAPAAVFAPVPPPPSDNGVDIFTASLKSVGRLTVILPATAEPPIPTPTDVPAEFEYNDSGTRAVDTCALAVVDPPAASVAVTDTVYVELADTARHEPLVTPLGEVVVEEMLFAPLTEAPTDAEYVTYT